MRFDFNNSKLGVTFRDSRPGAPFPNIFRNRRVIRHVRSTLQKFMELVFLDPSVMHRHTGYDNFVVVQEKLARYSLSQINRTRSSPAQLEHGSEGIGSRTTDSTGTKQIARL